MSMAGGFLLFGRDALRQIPRNCIKYLNKRTDVNGSSSSFGNVLLPRAQIVMWCDGDTKYSLE